MTPEDLLDLIDEAYNDAPSVTFSSVEDALKVAGSSLRWLTDQCDDGSETENTD